MTPEEEEDMHNLAERLAKLTDGIGWEASRYWSIAMTMKRLNEFCPTCDCAAKKSAAKK